MLKEEIPSGCNIASKKETGENTFNPHVLGRMQQQSILGKAQVLSLLEAQ